MSMLTGRRRPCLVLFQDFTETDGQYGVIRRWRDHRLAWVNLALVRGNEDFVSNETEAKVSYDVRGDWRDLDGITERMRMIYSRSMEYGNSPTEISANAEVFRILAVMPSHNDNGDTQIRVQREERRYGEAGIES